jgi:RNA polymerase sigma-70 factor (ECF subfamily)
VKSNAVNPAVESARALETAVGDKASANFRLMRSLRAGDEAAMRRLLEMHGEMLSRLVGRLTGWHADRDDILQDVLLAVWQKAGTFRESGSLESWLRSIAINRCRNYFRASSSLRRMVERLVSFGVAESAKDIDLLEVDEAKQRLQVGLQRLSQADRTVLVLFYLEENSGEEISRMLKIKQETLHTRLHRARQKLKLVLGDGHDEIF